MPTLIKKPSAWLPIAMSVSILAMLLLVVVIQGFRYEADEGMAAHLFQILLAGQLPIIAFFVIKWLPKHPKQALEILALQIFAVLAACAPVAYFHL